MAMNFYPPTSGPQNQLHIQQGTHNTCLSENNSAQLDTSPHLNRFEHIKIIKVEDVLHYFETIPHSFDNNHEVVNSLIDVIKTYRLFSRLSHRKCTTAHTSGSHQQQLKRIFQ
ncbi:uncharacterized protein LOC116849308 isoform X6 [Odontomachus brunneus]|uniref:uncharacterized protein LOC116849308 isoform X6 n=1 Tax=Odontomachus brunneus TaxID=486640 RepID=UPI0013F299D5|nr:uncharacterized protein LOC116849308 isoform X6 [Odontomachus brunneus]